MSSDSSKSSQIATKQAIYLRAVRLQPTDQTMIKQLVKYKHK